MRDNGLIQVFSISVRQEVIEPVSRTVNNEGRSFVKWNPSDHVHCPFIKMVQRVKHFKERKLRDKE